MPKTKVNLGQIIQALNDSKGSIDLAARLLKIHRSAIDTRLRNNDLMVYHMMVEDIYILWPKK